MTQTMDRGASEPIAPWTVETERVFFVPRRDIARGFYPGAQPVLLVEPSLAHRYSDVHRLDVEDPPAWTGDSPYPPNSAPVFAIDAPEVAFLHGVRLACISVDRRRAVKRDARIGIGEVTHQA